MLISFHSLLRSLRHLRKLELYLKFFNKGFASVLFLIKCSCLLLTILSGFSAIRLVHTNPLMSVIYIVIIITTVYGEQCSILHNSVSDCVSNHWENGRAEESHQTKISSVQIPKDEKILLANSGLDLSVSNKCWRISSS